MSDDNSVLRTSALPRLAGRLTFMRAKFEQMEELTSDKVAVIGIPFESDSDSTGYRYASLGIRETSVYYGWFSNPQFKSAPIDVVSRQVVDTGCINEKLVDIGDISLDGLTKNEISEKISSIFSDLQNTKASTIVLAGSEGSIYSVVKGISEGNQIGYIQLGGSVSQNKDSKSQLSVEKLVNEKVIDKKNMIFIAPNSLPTIEFYEDFVNNNGKIVSKNKIKALHGNYRSLFEEIRDKVDEVVAVLDISFMDSSLHGMSEKPNLNGMSLVEIQNMLIALGQIPTSSLIVTGIDPTVNGFGIVKTGQRMLVTALLKYIYARMDLLEKDEVII